MNKREKFLALVSKEKTKTVERAKERLASRKFRKISNLIAFEILERLEHLGWKQKDLADKMNVSPQQVNKWVKGRENFTLETLVNLSEILGVQLITVGPGSVKSFSVGQDQFTQTDQYSVASPQKRIVPLTVFKDSLDYNNEYSLVK